MAMSTPDEKPAQIVNKISALERLFQIGHVYGHINVSGQAVIQIAGLNAASFSDYIRRFIQDKIGREDHPQPFGGRTAELTFLNEWLVDETSHPYCVVTGQAGSGKSTLLAYWAAWLASEAAKLEGGDTLHILFHPISIQARTSLAQVTFQSLAVRLAQIHGEADLLSGRTTEEWRNQASRYLERPLPAGKQLVLILDGIDEAAGWDLYDYFFPDELPNGLRVVISARSQAGISAQQLADRLKWGGVCKILELGPFGLKEVEEVSNNAGILGSDPYKSSLIVNELFRLSNGDPLLTKLYIEQLSSPGVSLNNTDDLKSIEPGLEGLFKLWWEHQTKQWKESGSPAERDKEVLELLHLCAAAFGPLLNSEIRFLTQGRLDSNDYIDSVIKNISRWVIGDGTDGAGYTFSHARLANFFWDRLGYEEQQRLDERYLTLGRSTLSSLIDGVAPKGVSRYAVEHYGEHLDRANAPTEDYARLLHQAWRHAKEALRERIRRFFL